MSVSLKKLWNEYGITGLLIAAVVVYCLYTLFNYMSTKGSIGNEKMSATTNPAYTGGSAAVVPSNPIGQNEVFAPVNGVQTTGQNIPTGCTKNTMQNPSDLLPQDANSQWSQLNPSGKGELANINLLKAGYHIGIDTIGQTLRNANLQIRSEPPNPQLNVGPWNQSTISSDYMRPSLEIGAGPQ